VIYQSLLVVSYGVTRSQWVVDIMPQEEKVPKKVNVLFCVLHGRIQERTCLVIGSKHRGIK
ncbi:hypothetical protein AX14_011921, partial [Amanita brunnescens Koide BX004]